MKMIKLHNGENGLGKNGFTMEMNAFGDMTGEEFRNLMMNIPIPTLKKGKNIQKRLAGDVPKFINWRKKGYVTPVRRQEGPCRYSLENSTASITGLVLAPKSEKTLMNLGATIGPISVAIDARHDSFQFYKGGIYHEPNCSSSVLTHAMLVVGYGFEGRAADGRKYWLVKNSMGKKWGIRGYMKIAKDQRNHCGIATYAMYPTV